MSTNINTPTEWVITMTHQFDNCHACIEAGSSAVAMARATGSISSTMTDGIHVATARRKECGAVADLKRESKWITDPVCHQPAGHSGTHVCLGARGEREGFIYTTGLDQELPAEVRAAVVTCCLKLPGVPLDDVADAVCTIIGINLYDAHLDGICDLIGRLS